MNFEKCDSMVILFLKYGNIFFIFILLDPHRVNILVRYDEQGGGNWVSRLIQSVDGNDVFTISISFLLAHRARPKYSAVCRTKSVGRNQRDLT